MSPNTKTNFFWKIRFELNSKYSQIQILNKKTTAKYCNAVVK